MTMTDEPKLFSVGKQRYTIVLSFGPVSFMSLLPVDPMFRRMREEIIWFLVLVAVVELRVST